MKKLITMLLALAMVLGMLSGCGSSAVQESTASAASETASETETEPEAAEEDEEASAPAEAAPAEETSAEEAEVTASDAGMASILPCDETVTLTMMWPWVGFYNTVGIEDMSQSVWLNEMEARTNVHLDLTLVGDEYETTFMLMCAGGDLTDIIASADSNYSTGADACVEDEIIIDLSDKLEEYAPNYYKLLSENEDIRKQSTTDSGYVTSFKYTYSTPQTNRNLPVIRKDILDELGMDVPETLDEVHELLTIARDQYNMDCALLTDDIGTSSYIQTAFGPYGLYIDDGTVVYDYRTENFKNYVDYMRSLVADGLVNSDFVSMDVGADYSAYVTGGRSLIVNGMLYSDMNQYEDDGIDLVALPSALADASVKSEMGDIPVYAASSNATSISTQCENVEIAMAFFDYNYSEEGALLANYGVEGVTFEYDENGKPQYTEKITANPDIPQVLTLMYDCCWACGYLLDIHNLDGTLTEDELVAQETYQAAFSGHSQTYPSDFITLTSDESSEISTIQTDLDTYVEENVAHFIAGDQDMSGFDSFVESIYEKFDMDTLTSVYADAYERYLAR